MILFRPVALQELELIYDNGMKAFPARLPQQPIFYPVLQLEYARQIASDWNAKNGQLAGYVTQFKVEDQYINKFEVHTVGSSQHQEFWIPAEEVNEFNRHIVGHIKVVEAHFGDAFEGFIPEKFGLQGKNAVEQFTLLANSYVYKRMDFYLEIKRNHKAVFLNYPFWQTYAFKNPGLKEKTLQAIKEAWLTSFPQTPLPLPSPAREETLLVQQTDSDSWVDSVEEDSLPGEETDFDAEHFENPVHEEIRHVEKTDSQSLVNLADEDVIPVKEVASPPLAAPIPEAALPAKQSGSHFSQGLEFGLSGRYREAIGELSKAVDEDPDHVTARTSLGVAFHRLEEDERALACYETALKMDPICAEAHYFRANILYNRGNIREAIAGYTVAVGLQPELIEAHQKPSPQDRLTDYSPALAEMYRIAKPAYRILELNKLLESNQGQANLLKERAAEYYRLRNYAQAIADYSSSLAIRPDDASALHARGVAYEQLGQSERALEDYQKAIAIDPQLSNVYINRGVALGQMGNLRQSIASLTEGIRLAPRNPDSYFNRGIVYFQQGDIESAIVDFSKVIELSSNDEEAYYWRGISRERAGRQREAISDYRQFLTRSQDPQARAEVEQKLRHWNVGERDGLGSRSDAPEERQQINAIPAEESDPALDLYDLIVALGERALNSTWFGSDVDCYGEKSKELSALTDRNRPIQGRDLLHITSGIHQTIAGEFQAFDPDVTSPWLFIRAWDGSGFYIETDDPQIKKQLQAHFQWAEEVEGAAPPYTGLFIRI